MSFIINVFSVAASHPLSSFFLNTLGHVDFTLLEPLKSVEATFTPIAGASAAQEQIHVAPLPLPSQPALPDNVRFIQSQTLKTPGQPVQKWATQPTAMGGKCSSPRNMKIAMEPNRAASSEQKAVPSKTSTLIRKLVGKGHKGAQSKSDKSEEKSKRPPLPSCQKALESSGSLEHRVLTGGSHFYTSLWPQDHETVISFTNHGQASGFTSSVNQPVQLDATRQLMNNLDNKGLLGTQSHFRWADHFTFQKVLGDSSQNWDTELYDNLMGADCRWKVQAILGGDKHAQLSTLLGLIYQLPETGETFFVQIFNHEVLLPPAAPLAGPQPLATTPLAMQTTPYTDQRVPRLEAAELDSPPTQDLLENDPTFQEEDEGIEKDSQTATPILSQKPLPQTESGTATTQAISILNNNRATYSYSDYGTATPPSNPSPRFSILSGDSSGPRGYMELTTLKQPKPVDLGSSPPVPPPPPPVEPPVPGGLVLSSDQLTEAQRTAEIDLFIETVVKPYGRQRHEYEQKMAQHERQKEQYKKDFKRWQEANRQAGGLAGAPPLYCKDGARKPCAWNRTDFNGDGSGSGFASRKQFGLTMPLSIQKQ